MFVLTRRKYIKRKKSVNKGKLLVDRVCFIYFWSNSLRLSCWLKFCCISMSDGFDFEEDDDHLLERIDNHEEFIRKQEHIEAIKDAVWKWRYWMIAAGVALLVLSIAALAFAVSRGSSGEPSPLFTSQERDQAF